MGQPKFRPVKHCIFCPNKADSREHGWSDWALQRLKTPTRIFGRVDDQLYHDPNQKQLWVRCVCVECNTGWMKNLEDAVIPTVGEMMNGVDKTLSVDEQRTIVEWAVKSAMVFEHVSRGKEIFYAERERYCLREQRAIPEDTAVWLARVDEGLHFYTRGNDASSDGKGGGVRGYFTTMAYGRLALQVVTLRTAGYPASAIAFPSAYQWQHLTVRIWPDVGKSVRWPGHGSILEQGLDRFHERFVVPVQSFRERSYSLE